MKKQNIVLVGFYGSQKKEIGQSLAKKLGLPFADLDTELEFVLGESIESFVEKHGWQVLREVEQRVAHDFCRNFSGVISTGASTIENSKNLQNLKKTGYFVFIHPDFSDVRKFLLSKEGENERPPRINEEVPLAQELDQMWNQRKMIYSATSDAEVEPDITQSPDQECEKIINAIPAFVLPEAGNPKKVIIMTKESTALAHKITELKTQGRIPKAEILALMSQEPLKKIEGVQNMEHIPQGSMSTEDYSNDLINIFREYNPDIILMDGWDTDISPILRDQFGQIMIDIHHSLLPDYADQVAPAIYEKPLEDGEKYSGCSFYRLSADYQSGETTLQRKVIIEGMTDPKQVQEAIEKQELLGYAEILEKR